MFSLVVSAYVLYLLDLEFKSYQGRLTELNLYYVKQTTMMLLYYYRQSKQGRATLQYLLYKYVEAEQLPPS